MTAHYVSMLNHEWLHADCLCAVTDRAYSGTLALQIIHSHQ